MSACRSECDCYPFVNEWGCDEHTADCHSRQECGYRDGGMCDKHYTEAETYNAYLRGLPRYMVIDDEQSREELNQELRDAGRGHLVRAKT